MAWKRERDEDGRSYWIELLSNVFGVENVTERIDFEKKVVVIVYGLKMQILLR